MTSRRKFFGTVALLLAVATTSLTTLPRFANAGTRETERWMAQEARRKLQPYHFNQIKNVAPSLSRMRVIGTAVRIFPNRTRREYNWEVRFHVKGSGSRRQLVAESPIIKN